MLIKKLLAMYKFSGFPLFSKNISKTACQQ